jgi:TetR/AcrR family transcriptional repressor of mexJK operon
MPADATLTRGRAKREQIRVAAQRLFLANGVAATSMDAIAAEAGVSKQTVYAHFHSKEALLNEVLEDLVTRRAAVWREALRRDPAPRTHAELVYQLETLVAQIADTLMHPDYLDTARVIISECARNPDLGDLFRRAVAEPVLRVVAEVVAGGMAAGLLRKGDPHDAARLLVGGLLTFVLLDGLLKPSAPQNPDATDLARIVGLFVNQLVA